MSKTTKYNLRDAATILVKRWELLDSQKNFKMIKVIKNFLLFLFLISISACNQDENMNEENMTTESLVFKKLYIPIQKNSDAEFKIDFRNMHFQLKEISLNEVMVKKSDNSVFSILKDKENNFKVTYYLKDEKIVANLADVSFLFRTQLVTRNTEDVNPCDQHAPNETFNKCFEREWKDFCSDAPSCIAQAVNPVVIAAAIAIHCATC